MKTDKVVIIGCGNIGRRHLQAALFLNKSLKIFLYDCLEKSIEDTFSLIKETDFEKEKHEIAVVKNYDRLIEGNIVVVATTAKERALLIKEIAALKPLAILSEKPLTQSYDEYKELLEDENVKNCSVYVNFPRHKWPLYQKISKEISERNLHSSVSISCIAGNLEIACNGLHYIELACWLSNAKGYQELFGEVDNKLLPSKRGKDYIDFTGRMMVKFDNGASFYLNAIPDSCQAGIIYIQDKERAVTIWEDTGMQIEYSCNGEASVTEQKIPFVSQTSKLVIDDLLKTGKTMKLPTVEQSALAHKILFDFLKKYANKTLFSDITSNKFPIT